MIVAGHNIYKVLCAESNNNSVKNPPAISPSLPSILDIPSLLSYSVYDEHAILIYRDGRGFVVGNGVKGKVLRENDSSIYEKITQLIIKDDEGNACNFVSAVCGTYYTLFLLQSKTGDKAFKLAFTYYNTPNEKPLFLNVGERNPIAIYGGHTTAAAICSDGSVFILTEGMFRTPNEVPPILILPNKEKAVYAACMEELFILLSETGKLYKYVVPLRMPRLPPVTEIEDLRDNKIVQFSGTAGHCLAVTEDGRAFGWGTNESGRIGIENSKGKITTFTEITALKDYKIRIALAGAYHSLFLTNKGRVLSTGCNYDGELILDSGPTNEDVLLPLKTTVKHGATFGIAGIFLSALFVDVNPPPNMPNTVVKSDLPTLPDPQAEVKLPPDVVLTDQISPENNESTTFVAAGKVKSHPVINNDLLDTSGSGGLRSKGEEEEKSGASRNHSDKKHQSSEMKSLPSSGTNRDAKNRSVAASMSSKNGTSASKSKGGEVNKSKGGEVTKDVAIQSKLSESSKSQSKSKGEVNRSITSPSKISNISKEPTSASRLSMTSTFGEFSEVAGLRQQILEMKELLDSKDKEIKRLTMLNDALLDNDRTLQSNLGGCWENQQSKIDEIDVLMTKKKKDSK